MKSISVIVKEFISNKELKPSQLARLCNTTEGNMIKKLKKNDMDTAWVERISTALKHDFFADLSLEWKMENMGVMAVNEPSAKYGKDSHPLEDYIEQRIIAILEKRTKGKL